MHLDMYRRELRLLLQFVMKPKEMVSQCVGLHVFPSVLLCYI